MLKNIEHNIYDTIHSYAKVYPTFTKLFEFETPYYALQPGWEPETEKLPQKRDRKKQNPTTIIQSRRRTKTRIQDIVLCNEFTLFATFTFKSNRQSTPLLKAQMSKWLNNQQQRKGKFKYLIVPEYHKDGKSIHFHALLQGYKGELIDSGKRINGRKAYNVKSYKLGFSTVIEIDNTAKVASYIRKYITKDMPQFNGKKRYWASTGLIRPQIILNPNIKQNPFVQFTQQYKKNGLTISISSVTIPKPNNLGVPTWHIQNNFSTLGASTI